jgi:hypothetical protein
MPRVLLLTILCATALVLPATSAEPVLSHYRGVTLGDSVQVVADRLQVMATEAKVVHERPTLVQQITWRPNRFVSGTSVEPDPLAEMVLTFNLGQLARIAVIYDRERTQGMTNADLLEALVAVYGPSLLPSMATGTTTSSTDPETIGRWSDAETLLLLSRDRYPSRVSLTITAIAADLAMQKAIEADRGNQDAEQRYGRKGAVFAVQNCPNGRPHFALDLS